MVHQHLSCFPLQMIQIQCVGTVRKVPFSYCSDPANSIGNQMYPFLTPKTRYTGKCRSDSEPRLLHYESDHIPDSGMIEHEVSSDKILLRYAVDITLHHSCS